MFYLGIELSRLPFKDVDKRCMCQRGGVRVVMQCGGGHINLNITLYNSCLVPKDASDSVSVCAQVDIF